MLFYRSVIDIFRLFIKSKIHYTLQKSGVNSNEKSGVNNNDKDRIENLLLNQAQSKVSDAQKKVYYSA